MSSNSALSAAVDDRKARLAKLKSLKRKRPGDLQDAAVDEEAPASPAQEPPQSEDAPDVTRLHLSGRNYDPEARGPKLGFEHDPTAGLEKPTLEEQAAEVEDEVKRQAAEDAQQDKGVDLFKLQPKKPNWDLKRDLEKKLEILNARTDNAIAKLIRERIATTQKAKQGGEEDEAGGLDGVSLVEGVRLREKEEGERRDDEDDA